METSKKRVLVLMSAYNGEKHLRAQIDSILNQETSREVRLRIRDDGSKDGTCEIVEEYIKKYPRLVELRKGGNTGYNASFFTLLRDASGYDYYAISDQDDVWMPDKLQTACDAIDREARETPLLYASISYLTRDDLKPYGTTRKKERELSMYNTIIQNICPGHTQVMNNALLELLKADIDVSRIYVYDSWIANVANLYGKILFDNEAHTYYRQHDGNQLGYGAGKLGQLLASVRRTGTDDGKKYRRQIEYFVERNESELREAGFYQELRDFVSADSFWKKVRYCIKGKTYRQRPLETIAFKCAVILGKY